VYDSGPAALLGEKMSKKKYASGTWFRILGTQGWELPPTAAEILGKMRTRTGLARAQPCTSDVRAWQPFVRAYESPIIMAMLRGRRTWFAVTARQQSPIRMQQLEKGLIAPLCIIPCAFRIRVGDEKKGREHAAAKSTADRDDRDRRSLSLSAGLRQRARPSRGVHSRAGQR
jgi:hypothetical protein